MEIPIEPGRDASVSLNRGEHVDILLESFAGSGLEWRLEVIDAQCDVLGHKIEAGGAFGERGRERFTIRPVGADCQLRLRLKAPWRTNAAAESRLTLSSRPAVPEQS